MPRRSFRPRWASLAKLGTAVMGFSALFATETRANNSGTNPANPVGARPHAAPADIGRLLVRSEGGTLYLSEDGTRFEELVIDDSADGKRVKRLLEELEIGRDPVSVPVSRVIVADGGASPNLSKRNTKQSNDDTSQSSQGK